MADRPAGGGKQFRKRQRSSDSDEDDSGGISAVSRATKAAPLVFSSSTSSRSAGSNSAADGGGSMLTAIQSDRSAAPHQAGGGAFATLDINTETSHDGRAIYEKQLAASAAVAAGGATTASGGTGSYQGLASYTNYLPVKNAAEALAANKVTGTHGPLRAPTNVRGIVRIDYAPDVCKDYKETGYCGFGDSCIFLHDRGDYKMGWQLDKEWDAKQKARETALARHVAGGGTVDDFVEEAEPPAAGKGGAKKGWLASKKAGSAATAAGAEEALPFACLICRERFTSPVQTQCGHYFCERCAMARYASDNTCAACGKQTHGIFNVATKLAARLRAQAEAVGGSASTGGGAAAAAAAAAALDGGGGSGAADDGDDAEGASRHQLRLGAAGKRVGAGGLGEGATAPPGPATASTVKGGGGGWAAVEEEE